MHRERKGKRKRVEPIRVIQPEVGADAVEPPHVYHPDKATNGLGERKLYACGYCGYQKLSCSAASDGQVRIRCKCGGLQADGKSRMHAHWTDNRRMEVEMTEQIDVECAF
jgi:hypothetical protein